MAQRVTAAALRAARTRLHKATKDALRRALFAITMSFEVCGNLDDDSELLAAIRRALQDYGLLPLEEKPMVPEQREPRQRFLVDVIDCPNQTVAPCQPDPDVYATWILPAFAYAVHHLFNDTCRCCGVAISDAVSEGTYSYARSLAEQLNNLLRAAWREQDALASRAQEEREEKFLELRRCEAKAAQLRRELGLPKDDAGMLPSEVALVTSRPAPA